MLNRILQSLKLRSNVTLRQWSCQCEYIIAQRSRRFQQLLTFYHRVWGDSGFKELLRSYRTQFQPPIRGLMLSAVGAAVAFDWDKHRIELSSFDVCRPDVEFLERTKCASLCEMCSKRSSKFCYCGSSNKAPIWEPYVQRENITIWRREEKPSLYAYKIYARYDDITADDFVSVQTDIEYRKRWDHTAVKLEVVESDNSPGSNSHLIYWEMRWPKFFANRDYVYCRRVVNDNEHNAVYIFNRAAEHPAYPEDPEKVRVNKYWSYMVIKPIKSFHEPGIHYILTYFDDPGLSLPASIKSWVTQSQMPEFLNRLYEATKRYAREESEKKQKLTEHLDLPYKCPETDYRPNKNRRARRGWRQHSQEEKEEPLEQVQVEK